jgi:hypothetical protein
MESNSGSSKQQQMRRMELRCESDDWGRGEEGWLLGEMNERYRSKKGQSVGEEERGEQRGGEGRRGEQRRNFFAVLPSKRPG